VLHDVLETSFGLLLLIHYLLCLCLTSMIFIYHERIYSLGEDAQQ